MPRRLTPPQLAIRLLEWRLPEEVADAILGDLEHEYRERVERGVGRLAADAWYWGQALTVRSRALRRAAKRVRTVPTSRIAARRRGTARVSWLDVKLGLRMLRKHPAMTLAALFALAVGIPVGLAPMHLAHALEASLPEDRGDRIRAIRYWDMDSNRPQSPTYFELSRWREELTTFDAIGASRIGSYNLSSEDETSAPVQGAEVTAATFEILATAPLLGRTLQRADELTGAADVVVLGYDLWQARFAGDRSVLGRTLQVGQVTRTIVGVMPRGFLFPSRAKLWVPLREEFVAAPREAMGLAVFGRLSQGVAEEDARAAVATSGQRMAAEFPEDNTRLQVEVLPFGFSAMGLPRGGPGAVPGFYPFQALCFVLLLVACANVAMLIFARTVTRFGELAIRTALGAGRGRIVVQMFVESLVLTVSAAGLGLLAYDAILGRLGSAIEQSDRLEPFPYWFDLGVSSGTVVWALVFAVLSAAIVGALPALKVTGKRVQQSIQSARADRSGLRFGGATSALIVADVAIAVTVAGFGIGLSDRLKGTWNGADTVGIPAEEYLSAAVTLPASESMSTGSEFDSEEFGTRLAASQRTLAERLEAEPRVRSVAFASSLPRMDHEALGVDVEGGTAFDDLDLFDRLNRFVATAKVDVDFFAALDQPILVGRDFDRADLVDDARPVIVNTSFVDRLLDGRNPIGRRIRLLTGRDDEEAPWHEIVGVVKPLGTNLALPEYDQAIYLPAAPGEIYPLRLAVHLDGSPEAFTPRLRQIVNEIDPGAVIVEPAALNRVYPGEWYLVVATTTGIAILVVILMAMAASGIYAIMSFAVSERTREIGIMIALGAKRGSIVLKVARRSLVQIGLGALLGMPLAGWLFQVAEMGDGATDVSVGVAFGTAVAVVGLIGLLSCLSPMRRALRIEPTEALRGV
jgi:putative ABC transport system permease protein